MTFPLPVGFTQSATQLQNSAPEDAPKPRLPNIVGTPTIEWPEYKDTQHEAQERIFNPAEAQYKTFAHGEGLSVAFVILVKAL